MLRVCNLCNGGKQHSQYTHKTIIQWHFTLSSPYLEHGHIYANNKIEKCLQSVINTSNDKHLWIDRNDVLYNIEVYLYQKDFLQCMKWIFILNY